ncbi:hypothetical protein FBY30_0204 [Arthrobacter sp. SLBN-83]|uniref:hypothetical protein n=1 Tax=Arthrobacter sp. SLBN-83 TaxID=2768449 RepID=UPI001153DB43|nr:hypothetical protein [Arthrobacter sp. SLBN-83]TQJ58003.1 hypothetical protein FBY30_0204 [Arthrobacter sp. SLBN-83]
MSADILTFRSIPLSQVEAARRRAMLLHPSNFKSAATTAGSEASGKAQDLRNRFECLYEDLMERGLSEQEARTEVARIAAREVWDGYASELRNHRTLGRQMDANILAVALTSIQCVTKALPRHPGDLEYAGRAVSTARRRPQYNGGLLHRLHPHRNPAFEDGVATFEALEDFLRPQQRAA